MTSGNFRPEPENIFVTFALLISFRQMFMKVCVDSMALLTALLTET
jgi:hypothetical protein